MVDRIAWPWKVLLYSILIFFGLSCLLPFLMLITSSFVSEDYILAHGYPLFSTELSLDAYKFLGVYKEKIIIGYKVSLISTAGGSFLSIVLCVLLAYPLSCMDFKFRNAVSFYIFFTMMFSGGLIPSYILTKQYLHLGNTIWVLIIPGLVAPGNVFLLRIFMQNLPKEIFESARLDGAGEYTILFRIVIPLVKSGIATVTLFIVLAYWSDVVTPRLYIDDRNLIPLPLLLDGLAASVGRAVGSTAMGAGVILTTPMLFAMCIVATGPMLFVFQFFQKYFVEGMVIGAVKG